MNIVEIQILSDDLEQTEKFYSDLLGLKTSYEDKSTISFIAGASVLTFTKSENKKPYYHFAFNIPHNQIYEALEWMKTKTGIIQLTLESRIADFTAWNAKSFYFYDNNGNILEFIARYDLKNASKKPFNVSSILYISEIGIVKDDALAASKVFVVENDFLLFTKAASPDKEFAVLGDDHGLLIIVKEGRDWYPTDKKAIKFWSKITVKENEMVTDIITGT